MLAARAGALALAFAVAAAAPRARADGPQPLKYDLAVDVPLTSAALAAWIASEAYKERLAPDTCRFCGTNSFDAWARDLLLVDDVKRARRASDLLAFAAIPAAVAANAFLSAGAAGDASEGWVDMLVIAEAAALSADLNQLVKFTVGRQRPFVHYGNHEPGRAPHPDDNVSFYSGHTSLTFSLAAAAGTVSSMRGYRSAPWVWGIGMAAATTTGLLRIAGDKHYLTDVLVGAAAGTAIGIAVPRLLHGKEKSSGTAGAQLVPALGGLVIVF